MVCQPALLDLDQHILSKVLAALDPVSLARVITACRALRTAGSDEALWQEHCKKRWIHPHKHLLHGTALRLGGMQGVHCRTCLLPYMNCAESAGNKREHVLFMRAPCKNVCPLCQDLKAQCAGR